MLVHSLLWLSYWRGSQYSSKVYLQLVMQLLGAESKEALLSRCREVFLINCGLLLVKSTSKQLEARFVQLRTAAWKQQVLMLLQQQQDTLLRKQQAPAEQSSEAPGATSAATAAEQSCEAPGATSCSSSRAEQRGTWCHQRWSSSSRADQRGS
jgi:hypothetical protein